jgi:putative heme iron utilization protein
MTLEGCVVFDHRGLCLASCARLVEASTAFCSLLSTLPKSKWGALVFLRRLLLDSGSDMFFLRFLDFLNAL